MKHFYSILALIIVSIFTFNVAARAELSPPTSVSAEVVSESGDFSVELQWYHNFQDSKPDGFYIYRINSWDSTGTFELYTSVPNLSSNDSGDTFSYTDLDVEIGRYMYYIRAYVIEGDTVMSAPSAFARAEIMDDDELFIEGTPATALTLGDTYSFCPTFRTAMLGSLGISDVNVELTSDYPSGTTGQPVLNDSTGCIEWTPTVTGTFSFTLNAELTSDPDIESSRTWSVTVSSTIDGELSIYTTPDSTVLVRTPYRYEARAYFSDSTADCSIRYRLEGDVPDSMFIDETTGDITWTPYETGTFTITLIAYCDEDDSIRDTQTWTLTVTDAVGTEIEIYGTPLTSAVVGVPYHYTVTARWVETHSTEGIEYVLSGSEPPGMTIDINSGELSWTPDAAGDFDVMVIARAADDASISDSNEWIISVTSDSEVDISIISTPDTSTIHVGDTYSYTVGALVTDSTLAGDIRYMFADSTYPSGMTIDELTGELSWTAVAAGTYTITVRAYLVSDPSVFDNQTWTITVSETEPLYVVIRGSVSSSVGMIAISYADIEFLAHSEGGYITSYHVKTDENGDYIFEAPDIYDYKIKVSVPFDSSQGHPDFYTIWYDGKNGTTDPDRAAILAPDGLDSETDMIEFIMEPVPPEDNKIFGNVVDSETQEPVEAKITLIMWRGWDDKGIGKDRTYDGVSSDFEFTNIIPGSYVVRVTPSGDKHLPGYYKENETAAKEWKKASIIEVGNDSQIGALTIQMDPVSKGEGNGKVQGSISEEDAGIILLKNSDARYIPGAYVYLSKEDGSVEDYSMSSSYGDFSVENLDYGTYTMLVDCPGYRSFTETIEITEEQSTIEQEVKIIETTTGINDQVSPLSIMKAYPNPSNGNLTINYTLEQAAKIKLSVYDMLGREQAVIIDRFMDVGTYDVHWSDPALPNGLYIIKLHTSGSIYTASILISK